MYIKLKQIQCLIFFIWEREFPIGRTCGMAIEFLEHLRNKRKHSISSKHILAPSTFYNSFLQYLKKTKFRFDKENNFKV